MACGAPGDKAYVGLDFVCLKCSETRINELPACVIFIPPILYGVCGQCLREKRLGKLEIPIPLSDAEDAKRYLISQKVRDWYEHTHLTMGLTLRKKQKAALDNQIDELVARQVALEGHQIDLKSHRQWWGDQEADLDERWERLGDQEADLEDQREQLERKRDQAEQDIADLSEELPVIWGRLSLKIKPAGR